MMLSPRWYSDVAVENLISRGWSLRRANSSLLCTTVGGVAYEGADNSVCVCGPTHPPDVGVAYEGVDNSVCVWTHPPDVVYSPVEVNSVCAKRINIQ